MDDFLRSFLRDFDKFITEIDKWIVSWMTRCWNDEPEPTEERELLLWEDVLREDYI
jgi:hypothetical protein